MTPNCQPLLFMPSKANMPVQIKGTCGHHKKNQSTGLTKCFQATALYLLPAYVQTTHNACAHRNMGGISIGKNETGLDCRAVLESIIG
jgi:hypothetical protein